MTNWTKKCLGLVYIKQVFSSYGLCGVCVCKHVFLVFFVVFLITCVSLLFVFWRTCMDLGGSGGWNLGIREGESWSEYIVSIFLIKTLSKKSRIYFSASHSDHKSRLWWAERQKINSLNNNMRHWLIDSRHSHKWKK